MRCPSCTIENPPDSATCAGCGEKLSRPARRRRGDPSGQMLVQAIPNNPRAVAAYRYAMFGMIPLAGLVLGACALGFGIVGYRYACTNPDAKGGSHAMTGIVLGSLEFLTNGVGLISIAIGLRSLAG